SKALRKRVMRSMETDVTEPADGKSLLTSQRIHARWHIKAVAYALMIVSSLVVLELLSYAYLRAVEGDDGVHLMNYEFDDYKDIRLTPNYENTRGIFHNAQGFRRKQNTPQEKPEGTYRIFIMGGSTAYGLGSLSRYGQEKYSIIRNDET